MNIEWVLKKLDDFVAMTTPSPAHSPQYSLSVGYAFADSEILAARVAIDQILDKVLPDWRQRFSGSTLDRYLDIRKACIYAKELVTVQNEITENLGADEPVIKISNIHPTVLEASKSLFNSGHYREAISNTGNVVLAKISDFSKRTDVSGLPLIEQLFSSSAPQIGKPRIKVPEFGTDDSTNNYRNGLKGLATAVVALMRNLNSHEALNYSKDECVEHLATMSLFLRNLEKCSLIIAED